MRYLIFTILFFFSVNTFAQRGKWQVGKEVKRKTDSGVFKGKVYQKYFSTKRHTFLIGSITYMSSPKLGQSFDKFKKDFKTYIKKGFGNSKEWRDRTYEKAYVVEGFWNKGNRLIKYFAWEDDQNFNYTVATSRISYGDSFYYDSEILQRLIYHEGRSVLEKKSVFIKKIGNFILSNAYAQKDCNCAPYDFSCRLLCNASERSKGVVQGPADTLGDGIGDLNNSIGGIQKEVGNLNQTARDQWGASNKNWEGTNGLGKDYLNLGKAYSEQLKAMQKLVGDKTGQVQGMIDENWKETNRIAEKGIDSANRIMKKSLTPKNAFLLAAATGAGAALGAGIVNLAINGVVGMAKRIIEVLKGSSDEKKLKIFKKALKDYEKLQSPLKKMEETLDTLSH